MAFKNMDGLSESRKRLLHAIGEEREVMAWEIICSIPDHFRPAQIYPLFMTEFRISRKTATMWWDALMAYWLIPGNSDLHRINIQFYTWKESADA